MTQASDRPAVQREPSLPTGSRSILPTIWLAFVVTVLLALAFSFANVWQLARDLHVERHVAPLVGPTVDITAVGLLVVVPWLTMAGVAEVGLRSARQLMMLAGFLTLALNSAPSAIDGWTEGDARAWGRAVVEAIVPTLLIAWSHVGPRLIGLFVEVQERHRAKVAEALRVAELASAEDVERRSAEIREAVAEALQQAAAEAEVALAEDRVRRDAEFAEILREQQHRQAELDTAAARSVQLEAEVAKLRERLRSGGKQAPRRASTGSPAGSVEDSRKAPRKSAAELLEERVEAAKDRLPMWQLETPSGTEIRSALGIKSDGIIQDIRKRLESDRLAATNSTGTN